MLKYSLPVPETELLSLKSDTKVERHSLANSTAYNYQLFFLHLPRTSVFCRVVRVLRCVRGMSAKALFCSTAEEKNYLITQSQNSEICRYILCCVKSIVNYKYIRMVFFYFQSLYSMKLNIHNVNCNIKLHYFCLHCFLIKPIKSKVKHKCRICLYIILFYFIISMHACERLDVIAPRDDIS